MENDGGQILLKGVVLMTDLWIICDLHIPLPTVFCSFYFLLYIRPEDPVHVYLLFGSLLVTGQSTSIKLHLDLCNHYGLIDKSLSMVSLLPGVLSSATALLWLLTPLDQFLSVTL